MIELQPLRSLGVQVRAFSMDSVASFSHNGNSRAEEWLEDSELFPNSTDVGVSVHLQRLVSAAFQRRVRSCPI